MGCGNSKPVKIGWDDVFKRAEFPITKEGVLYDDYVPYIRPLSLALFQGGDFVSDLIRKFQKDNLLNTSTAGYNIKSDDFSHVGLVITRDIFDDERLEPDAIYILESTMSGKLSDGLHNIDGESFLGVQIRRLDEVVQAYDKPNDTRVAIAPLREDIFENVWSGRSPEDLKKTFTEIVRRYEGIRYDANPISLFSSICKCLRPFRNIAENALDTEHWLFCSELAALIYKELELVPKTVNPKDVVPMDFLGFDTDKNHIPVIVEHPVYVVSDAHYSKSGARSVTSVTPLSSVSVSISTDDDLL